MLASDLHVHLDGSPRADTLIELSRDAGILPAGEGEEDFLRRLRFRPGMSLTSCLSRFDVTVGLLQTRRALERVARELVCDCYLDGVRHAEVRFCPALHTRAGLTPGAAVEAVLSGIEDGCSEAVRSAPDDLMSGRVTVSVLEGMGAEDISSLVDLAVAFSDAGVSGVDVAGDESQFDASRCARPFAMAKEAGLGVTVHAGEVSDATHIIAAVRELGADRIGHGVAAAESPEAMQLLADRGVTVEVCLSSNLHTGAVATLANHPLRKLSEAGVPVALATDNRFFSQTTLSREYELASGEAGANREVIERSVLASANAAFLPEAERASLRRAYVASLEASRHGSD